MQTIFTIAEEAANENHAEFTRYTGVEGCSIKLNDFAIVIVEENPGYSYAVYQSTIPNNVYDEQLASDGDEVLDTLEPLLAKWLERAR